MDSFILSSLILLMLNILDFIDPARDVAVNP